VTGRWTGRGLCLTGRVRSVLSVCACLDILIGRGGASGHDRPDASGHGGSLLDSNRTPGVTRSVSSAARPVADSLERCSGLTSAFGQLQDQCVRSSFARPVSVGLCDQRIRSARLQQFQLTNGSIRRGTSINTCWPALGLLSCIL
jgi:hypothetical protein